MLVQQSLLLCYCALTGGIAAPREPLTVMPLQQKTAEWPLSDWLQFTRVKCQPATTELTDAIRHSAHVY